MSFPMAPQKICSDSPSSDKIFDVFNADPPVCEDRNSHLNIFGKIDNVRNDLKPEKIVFYFWIYVFLAFAIAVDSVSDEHSPNPFGSNPYLDRISGFFSTE